MEGFFTLVVLIIVINLINTVMKAIRGGQTNTRYVMQGKKDLVSGNVVESPVKEKSDHGLYYYSVPDDDTLMVNDNKPDFEEYETVEHVHQDPADHGTESSREFCRENSAARLSKQKCSSDSTITTGLYQSLTRRDSLVSAFIFHEIFKRPPASRRRY